MEQLTTLRFVRSHAADAGRPGEDVQAALLVTYCRVGEEMEGREGSRQVFTGSADAIVEDISRYAERGLEHYVYGSDGYNLAGTLTWNALPSRPCARSAKRRLPGAGRASGMV